MAIDTAIPSAGDLTKDDILDNLMDETNDLPADDKEEKPAKKLTLDDEPDESDESDEESDEADESDEKEEKIDIIDEDNIESYKDVPARQAILKEFPELFKKFPGIESAIYRDKQYAEVFPTISDAREAASRLNDFKEFEGELLSGSLEGILKSVKGANEKAYSKITGNILETLQKVDEKAYLGTLTHVLKNGLKTAFDHGKESGDEDGQQLQIAAQLLHKFIFGSTNITAAEKIVAKSEPDEKETELTKREQAFNQQQLNNAVSDVTTRTDNLIKNTIDKHIDPKNMMTPYVKGKAVSDVLSQVQNAIRTDSRFVSHLNKMWLASQKDNFSESSRTKIREALISKARTILPGVIQKVKADALKGSATRKKEASESKDEKPVSQGRPASSSKTSSGLKDGKIPRGVSTLDFLNQD